MLHGVPCWILVRHGQVKVLGLLLSPQWRARIGKECAWRQGELSVTPLWFRSRQEMMSIWNKGAVVLEKKGQGPEMDICMVDRVPCISPCWSDREILVKDGYLAPRGSHSWLTIKAGECAILFGNVPLNGFLYIYDDSISQRSLEGRS